MLGSTWYGGNIGDHSPYLVFLTKQSNVELLDGLSVGVVPLWLCYCVVADVQYMCFPFS